MATKVVVEDAAILAFKGREGSGFCYEGWDGRLEDGRPCALGISNKMQKADGDRAIESF